MSELKQQTEAADGQSRLTAGLGMALECDASPLLLFSKILETALKGRERFFDFRDLGFELARVESDFCAAGTSKTLVRLYPSDAFLRFAATLFAGDFDLGLVQDSSHVFSSMPNVQIEGRAAFGASLSNAVLGVMWIARLPASASLQRTVRIWLRRIQATVFGRLPYATVHSRQ